MRLKEKINFTILLYGLFTLACAGLFVYVRIRHLDIAFERDEGEYTYAAQEILRGKIPYKDFYNMKTPLVYYSLAFLFRLFGDSVHTVKISLLCINLLSAFFIFLTARKLFSTHTGLVASGIYLIFCLSYSAQGWTANAEHFVVFYAMISLYFLAGSTIPNIRYPIPNNQLFFSGFFMMLAVLCKQQAVGFFIFPPIWLFFISLNDKISRKIAKSPNYGTFSDFETWRRILSQDFKQLPSFVSKIFVYSSGAIVPLGVLLIYLKAHHALYDCYHLCVEYAQAYGSFYQTFSEISNFHHIYNDSPVLWFFVLGFFFLLMTGVVREKQSGFLFLLFFFCFYSVSLGFFFRPHYFQLIFPVAAIMAGFFITHLNFRFSIFILIFALWSTIRIEKGYFYKESSNTITNRMYGFHFFTIKQQLGLELPLHIKDKNKTVCIFGNEPQVFFYSKLRSASGFLYLYPTIESQPFAQQMADKFIYECETRDPEILIYFNGTVPSQNPNTSEYLQKWFDKFKQNYKIIGQIYTAGGEPVIEWKYDSTQNKNKFMYALIYQK